MILVTGATGLLGNCVVRQLLQQGQAVRVLCRPQNIKDSLQGLDVQIVCGDLTDASSVEEAVTGCDAVIHCGALVYIGWQRLDELRKVNVGGTRNVVEACLRQHAKLIHVSTVDTLQAAAREDAAISETGGDGVAKPQCSYVISKGEAESVVREAIPRGLKAVIVHPGLMFGPYDWKPSSAKIMLALLKAPILLVSRGGGSICDARDVATALINAAKSDVSGRNYILGGENMRYEKLWHMMLETMQLRRRIIPIGSAVVTAGNVIDWLNRTFGLTEKDVNGAITRIADQWHYYDSSRAEQELGYRRRPVTETLADTWQWVAPVHAPQESRLKKCLPSESAATGPQLN
jgi:dihydroflavonol-4-reductase